MPARDGDHRPTDKAKLVDMAAMPAPKWSAGPTSRRGNPGEGVETNAACCRKSAAACRVRRCRGR
ncbi:MAG: hypothetical protein U1E38_01290 [Rhodospirillales bacterium]